MTAPLAGPRPPVTITVHGTPAPQGSKTARAYIPKGGGKARVSMAESAKAGVTNWRQDVRNAAGEAMGWGEHPPYDGPLDVVIHFTVRRPASAPKTRRTWPDKRPDIDKYVRSTFDALTAAGVWHDDAQAVRVLAVKDYPCCTTGGLTSLGLPGAVITIRQLSP